MSTISMNLISCLFRFFPIVIGGFKVPTIKNESFSLRPPVSRFFEGSSLAALQARLCKQRSVHPVEEPFTSLGIHMPVLHRAYDTSEAS
jgi:hypothetical protein